MRVLYVQHADALGGSAISLRYLIEGLGVTLENFEPHIMLSAGARAALASLYEPIVNHIHELPRNCTVDASINAQRLIDRLTSLKRLIGFGAAKADLRRHFRALLDREDIDLVHLNGSVLGPVAHVLLELDVPFVWHVREPAGSKLSPARGWVRQIMRRTPAMVFLTLSDSHSWLRGPTRPKHLAVIPNAVDFRLFASAHANRQKIRQDLALAPTTPVVLYVGGAVHIKGVRQILEATDLIREAHPNAALLMPGTAYEARSGRAAKIIRWCLRIAGHRTLGDSVRQMIADRPGACLALPATNSIQNYYAAADVVAFPSLVPHFARPAIEAVAAMRPIVASDLDGVREVVPQDVTVATLVPPGDVRRLGEAIVHHLNHLKEPRSRLRAARDQARREFDVLPHASRVANVYRQVLDHRTPSK